MHVFVRLALGWGGGVWGEGAWRGGVGWRGGEWGGAFSEVGWRVGGGGGCKGEGQVYRGVISGSETGRRKGGERGTHWKEATKLVWKACSDKEVLTLREVSSAD